MTHQSTAQGDRSVTVGRDAISSIIVTGDYNTVTIVFQSGEQRTVPFLSPPQPPYELVGRDELLHDLKQRLLTGDSLLGLCALNGLPGVGKTVLAVALAHDREVLGHFNDGVLWAGLGRKGDVLSHLAAWGAALGIPWDETAKLTSIEDRARAIHAAVGMRRILLVVDDAWKVEAALAFKLGGPNCAHIVTTRLPEVALCFAGERTTTVHELSEADGLALLARLAPQVVEAEPDEARNLARAVGGLPLGLVLVGSYLRVQAQSGQPRRVHAALDRLRRTEERLRLARPQGPLEHHPSLPAGVPLSLQAAIGISDEALDKGSRATLRALSVFPPKPNTFSERAALTVSGASGATLQTVCDYGLVESSGPDRYTLHQTIADYAKAKLADHTAYERMVEHFVRYAETHEMDYGALALEASNVLAALQAAFDQGIQAALVRGANAFYHFLETRGLYALAELHLTRAQQAARSSGDVVGLVTALLNLGRITCNLGEYIRAEKYLLEGLALARKIGHSERISLLLAGLGAVASNLGDYTQAEQFYQEGLLLAREIGHRERTSLLLTNLGAVAFNLGDYTKAERFYQEGLLLAREIGHPDRISLLLVNLGVMTRYCGVYAQAEEFYQEALGLARKIGHPERISLLLTNLGDVANKRGDFAQAQKYLLEGLALARNIGHSERINLLLENLGVVAINRGDYAQAEEYLLEGLALARGIGHSMHISILLLGLGVVAIDQGDYAQAEEHLLESLALARKVGHRWIVSEILNESGKLRLKEQDLDSASAAFLEALEMAQEMRGQESAAVALCGLAQVAAAQGNIVEARRQGQESLTVFEAIGHYKASEVAQWLTDLPTADPSE